MDEDYSYVRLAYEDNGSSKVLFVLDVVPTEDLHSGRMLSGVTGDLLSSLVNYTKTTYGRKSFSWLACSLNAFRTFGKSQEYRAQAAAVFAERLNALICKYKPDYVVGFGTAVTDALMAEKLVKDHRNRTRYSYWLGVPVERRARHKEDRHSYKYVSNLSLNDIVRGGSSEAELLGYIGKCLAPIVGKTYAVDSKRLAAHKSTVIDTYSGFKEFMVKIREQSVVSIDTEADNLNKIVNRLLTVQFAYEQDEGFLLPMNHKDSPFTPRELGKISGTLRDYFEGDNQNTYHIYTNAKFDLTLFKTSLGVGYFENDVWDILGGEFALDEALKNLDVALGEYYYSLGNLSVQYGFTGYLTAAFGKQDRARFFAADLNDPDVIHYTTLDVVVPLAIHEVQKQRAIDRKYKHHGVVVTKEISDTIHSFSTMEHTGAGLDVEYLFYLRTPNSPIENEVKRMHENLLNSPSAQKANKLLANKKGIPTTSLWGDQVKASSVLELNKPEHKHVLFFDVLGLEPIEKGASGKGKLDKLFQEKYAHIPEVAQYTALEKAKKLKNAYVKSFIRMLGENEDLRKTYRIRPNFGYLTVVTHRTSARDPNLQQVPARSALGKHIKRLFVARQGTLYIKVDYRVHEVRGWGIISFDRAVAKVFAEAKKLRDQYRLHPTPELAKRIATEADIHIQNASFFFSKAMEEIDKVLRNAVKGVVFGFIYGMGIKSMSANIKQDEDFTKKLLERFASRFPNAVKWSKSVKSFAREHLFVEAPTHIRRHLWGYLLPDSVEHASKVKAKNDRQGGNAPIQGMCSKFMMNGIRHLDKAIFEVKKLNEAFQLYITNSVHDSLENEAGYADLLKSIGMIEFSLTDGVRDVVEGRHGFKLISDLEVDFEIGASLSQCDSWDFSVAQLERLVMDSLLFQRNKLAHAIHVDKVHDIVFSPKALADAPSWMRAQVKNIGYKFSLTERDYILEIGNAGQELQAKAKALRSESRHAKSAARPDIDKRAQKAQSEGEELLDYARELAQARKSFRSKA
jgi:DNA polymerase I-like protein with 3'-5' exonuclease and polymerase domains